MTTKTQKSTSWDDESNEAQNNFVSWGQVGDFVYGTLIGVREVKSTLPDRAGELQKIYDIKVKESSYHLIDEKKRVIEEAVTPSEGELVSVGGRKTIDSRMARIKLGQVFGLKFTEEQDAKQKGYNPTKIIKVFTPRGTDGNFLMDEEYLNSQKNELDM
jgi:hypothetical protein